MGRSGSKRGPGHCRQIGYQEPVVPVVLPLVYEEAQELLNLLVDTFSLAIGLQVVGHRGCDFNPKYFAESSHEVRHELDRKSVV